MGDAVDRHATLEARPHPAEWPARLAAAGVPKRNHGALEQRSSDAHAGRDAHPVPVDVDRDGPGLERRSRGRRQWASAITTRSGAYGAASIAVGRRATRSASSSAVPNDVVMPSPSWPAAIHKPGVSGHGPLRALTEAYLFGEDPVALLVQAPPMDALLTTAKAEPSHSEIKDGARRESGGVEGCGWLGMLCGVVLDSSLGEAREMAVAALLAAAQWPAGRRAILSLSAVEIEPGAPAAAAPSAAAATASASAVPDRVVLRTASGAPSRVLA